MAMNTQYGTVHEMSNFAHDPVGGEASVCPMAIIFEMLCQLFSSFKRSDWLPHFERIKDPQLWSSSPLVWEVDGIEERNGHGSHTRKRCLHMGIQLAQVTIIVDDVIEVLVLYGNF